MPVQASISRVDLLSRTFVRTLREDPAEAETANHRLLVRGGYIRKAASGVYSYLPLGLRVLRRIEAVVRQEMAAAGCQELLMPALMPRDLWERSGRWSDYGDLMFRVVCRPSGVSGGTTPSTIGRPSIRGLIGFGFGLVEAGSGAAQTPRSGCQISPGGLEPGRRKTARPNRDPSCSSSTSTTRIRPPSRTVRVVRETGANGRVRNMSQVSRASR
jgi:hypothetical protein